MQIRISSPCRGSIACKFLPGALPSSIFCPPDQPPARFRDRKRSTNAPAAAPCQILLDLIRRYCDEIGRPCSEIERTTLGTVQLAPGAMSAPQVIEKCRSMAGIGIQHAIFNMPNVHEIQPLKTFGKEIIPAVAEF